MESEPLSEPVTNTKGWYSRTSDSCRSCDLKSTPARNSAPTMATRSRARTILSTPIHTGGGAPTAPTPTPCPNHSPQGTCRSFGQGVLPLHVEASGSQSTGGIVCRLPAAHAGLRCEVCRPGGGRDTPLAPIGRGGAWGAKCHPPWTADEGRRLQELRASPPAPDAPVVRHKCWPAGACRHDARPHCG